MFIHVCLSIFHVHIFGDNLFLTCSIVPCSLVALHFFGVFIVCIVKVSECGLAWPHSASLTGVALIMVLLLYSPQPPLAQGLGIMVFG